MVVSIINLSLDVALERAGFVNENDIDSGNPTKLVGVQAGVEELVVFTWV